MNNDGSSKCLSSCLSAPMGAIGMPQPTKKQTIGIVGYGEIGQALANFYQDKDRFELLLADLDYDQISSRGSLDILHICIPPSKDFESIVSHYGQKSHPEFIIIHSSVPVGTTQRLFKKLGNVVHSPVRGTHPLIFDGLSTFVKFVGSEDLPLAYKVVRHFNSIGIPAEVAGRSATTELGKLLDTTYYGLCLTFHAYAQELCKTTGADMKVVMKRFNETYNNGYTRLGQGYYSRPVLTPPVEKIGGHCIIPNAKIIKESFGPHPLIDEILKFDK